MSEIEVTDIEEAKLIISMKNDDINSLNNKMKMLEKKSNIKIAESSYQIQQEKNKYMDLQRKMERMKDVHEAELKKHEESSEKFNEEIAKSKEHIAEMQKNERQIERSHKAQLYEHELKLTEESQKRQVLKKELDSILKLFNPKEILHNLSLPSLESIIPYLKLYEKCKEQEEQIHSMNKQMEQHKAEGMKALEETFGKLSSYEEVMKILKDKNLELEQIMQETEKNLEEKNMELEEKENMLNQVEAFTNEKYYEMNEEIESLRNSVRNYERESLNYQENRQEHEKNLKFIFELTAEFERKEEEYLNKIAQLENGIVAIENQKQTLEMEYQEHLQTSSESYLEQQRVVQRSEKNLFDKEEIITMLSTSLKDLEQSFESSKLELEKTKNEVSELLRVKHKLKEELREAEHFYNTKEESLLEEVEMLKSYRPSSGEFKSEKHLQSDTVVSTSLEDELEPEPNWLEMYENCLQRHNKFIREVHYVLKKQERKASINLEDTKLLQAF